MDNVQGRTSAASVWSARAAGESAVNARLKGFRRYDSTEGIGRVESGTETESETGVRTEDACMEAGGTIPWRESVESSLERRPRLMSGTYCRAIKCQNGPPPMRQLKFKIQDLTPIPLLADSLPLPSNNRTASRLNSGLKVFLVFLVIVTLLRDDCPR